ncbi:Testis-specific Y-encoded protein 4 [Camelus dromedarius]|uniref:Testis-specific Y-encoded protein 4 n=1 Tax=Camelus dromedarius TaxID=9838 RepID=A0A5N4CXN2_CAMDR|nr:Testis-specific Y-encoded protein 4 [Camelus dromedarius]
MGEELVLMMADIMEVVEMVGEEEEEEEHQEQGPAEPGWGPRTHKIGQRRKPHLDRRRAIIQVILGFWAKANHPWMSAMIGDQDKGALSYTINLEVQELGHPTYCRRIAEIIGKDLWPNPLHCYPREEGTGRELQMKVTEHQSLAK